MTPENHQPFPYVHFLPLPNEAEALSIYQQAATVLNQQKPDLQLSCEVVPFGKKGHQAMLLKGLTGEAVATMYVLSTWVLEKRSSEDTVSIEELIQQGMDLLGEVYEASDKSNAGEILDTFWKQYGPK